MYGQEFVNERMPRKIEDGKKGFARIAHSLMLLPEVNMSRCVLS